jgi:phosphonate transport system permease protein
MSANISAVEIIRRRNAAKRRKSLLAAWCTDAFLGIYLVILLQKIFWLGVLFPAENTFAAAPELSFGWYALVIGLGGVLGVGMSLLRASPAMLIFGLLQKSDKGTWREAVALHWSWTVGILTVVAGWIITKISLLDFFSNEGLTGAQRIFTALFTPEFSIFGQAFYAIIETIYLALMATLLALPASFILSFFCAKNCASEIFGGHPFAMAIYYGLRFVSNLARSIEPLIWAIVFSVWVGIGPFAGMLALAVHTVASLVKQYSEQIEEIDNGMVEAIESTGAAPMQVIWYAVVPQIMLPFLSFTIYRWDINVRMATVIGLVGGGGIGTLLVQYQGLAKWNEVGLIIFMIAAVVWVMDYLSSKIRTAIR